MSDPIDVNSLHAEAEEIITAGDQARAFARVRDLANPQFIAGLEGKLGHDGARSLLQRLGDLIHRGYCAAPGADPVPFIADYDFTTTHVVRLWDGAITLTAPARYAIHPRPGDPATMGVYEADDQSSGTIWVTLAPSFDFGKDIAPSSDGRAFPIKWLPSRTSHSISGDMWLTHRALSAILVSSRGVIALTIALVNATHLDPRADFAVLRGGFRRAIDTIVIDHEKCFAVAHGLPTEHAAQSISTTSYDELAKQIAVRGQDAEFRRRLGAAGLAAASAALGAGVAGVANRVIDQLRPLMRQYKDLTLLRDIAEVMIAFIKERCGVRDLSSVEGLCRDINHLLELPDPEVNRLLDGYFGEACLRSIQLGLELGLVAQARGNADHQADLLAATWFREWLGGRTDGAALLALGDRLIRIQGTNDNSGG